MKDKYTFDRFGEVDGVEGETTILKINIEDIPVLVTKTINDSYGESYFNIYILNPLFKLEPLNNLEKNIPLENEPKDWEKYLTILVIQQELWIKYNKRFSVTEEED
jgi:hypothetical protein